MRFTSGAARLPALLRRPGERGGLCMVLVGLRGICLERESVMLRQTASVREGCCY